MTGNGHVYPAPAFALLLNAHGKEEDARAVTQRIIDDRYVDEHSNIVFIDMTVYDYLVESQVYLRLSAEFVKGGARLAVLPHLASPYAGPPS